MNPLFPFSVIFLNLGLRLASGRPAVGIYSPMGLPANKTHVGLQRNEEGLRTASFCIYAFIVRAQIHTVL